MATSRTPSEQLKARLLGFLAGQADDDFAESVEIQTAVPGYPLLIGAVFPLTLILLALDQAAPEDPAVQEVVTRLLGSLVLFGDADGWRYFNLCAEIPPDADDLAQVITLLVRRRHSDREAVLAGPLRRLVDNAQGKGRFRTWLVASAAEAETVDRQWAAGRDPVHPEVVANLLHALCLLDAEAWRGEILAGAEWLVTLQDAGLWASYWYYGHGYGTHQVLRLIAAVSERWPDEAARLASAQHAARSALLGAQRPDGSWEVARAPMGLLELGGTWELPPERALETALILSALHYLPPDEATLAAKERAIAFLESSQAPDGGFAAEPYYFTVGLQPHQSRCLTSAAVLSALSFAGHGGG